MTDAFTGQLTSGRDGRPLLWLDYLDYAKRLFVGADQPAWRDAAQVLSWHRQAQGLLRSDVVELDVLAYYADCVAAEPDLLGEGSATRALRDLLAAPEPRERFVSIVGALGDTYGSGTPMALRIGTPTRCLEWLAAQRGQDAPEVDEDTAEMAAMYVADFLRTLAQSPIAALLLVAPEQGALQDAEIRQPIVNVAAHYRWSVGMLGAQADDMDFSVGEGGAGHVLPETVWADAESDPALPETGFAYARIPPDANPETVLARLQTLRG